MQSTAYSTTPAAGISPLAAALPAKLVRLCQAAAADPAGIGTKRLNVSAGTFAKALLRVNACAEQQMQAVLQTLMQTEAQAS